MVLDSRITVFGSSGFRPKLSVQDVKIGFGDEVEIFSSNESLSNDDVQYSEKALLFLDKPICVPNMNYLFVRKLNSLKDNMLERLVRDLMFLNPSLSGQGANTMTSWILGFFVASGEDGKKVITYEQLLPKVIFLCEKYEGGDVDIIESNKVILYKKESLLTPDNKRWYSNYYRNKRMSYLRGEIIHEAAILASKIEHRLLKISKPIVLDHANEINNMKALNKHIEERTIRFLEDENKYKPLVSRKTTEKFDLFKKVYQEGVPLDFYTKELSVSKCTAVAFKKLLSKDY
jgi:hypothetical protein